jgi:AAA15 family ATPase/GTPase
MKLKIKNFRSIEEQEIDLAPITVLYGPNGSGKSSLLYALLTFRNIVLNSNQDPRLFFNYGFVNLGDYDAVVFDHDGERAIEFSLTIPVAQVLVQYGVTFNKRSAGAFAASIQDSEGPGAKFALPVSFPYPANQRIDQRISRKNRDFIVTWNGIVAEAKPEKHEQKAHAEAIELAVYLNYPPEVLRQLDIVPLKRGFSKPLYSPLAQMNIPFSPMAGTEDEIANLLEFDKSVQAKVRDCMKEIFDREFRVNVKPGTLIFSLDITDTRTGISCELVNEGFGINQIVHILAKCFQFESGLVLIEEPEIHLHPTAIRSLARALVRIAQGENKSFVISTHSESFVSALLALLVRGDLSPKDLACYLVQKEGKVTKFVPQAVNEKGQVEGGLTSFLEGELEDLKTFLKVTE